MQDETYVVENSENKDQDGTELNKNENNRERKHHDVNGIEQQCIYGEQEF